MNPIYALLWGDPASANRLAAGLDAAAWHQLDGHAAQHRLRPLLHNRAAQGGWDVPSDVERRWRASHRQSALRALTQKAALTRIGKVLAAGGVPAAALKGGAFVWSGGIEPALRPMRDLDLLIRPEDAEAAPALLRSIGFDFYPLPVPSPKHLPGMTNGKTVVELHLRVFDTPDDQARAREAQFIARAWARAVPTEFVGLVAFGPTDTLLHLILHAVIDHQFNNGPLLLTDMAVLAEGGGIDWALLWHEAEQLGVTRACQLALGFAESVSGLAVDWHGPRPRDVGAQEIEQVARLMLVDTAYRTAVSWPGQVLRLDPRRWPTKLAAMIRRRGDGDAALAAARGELGLGAALRYAAGAEGRSKIADAVRLSLWLRRG